MPPHVINRRLLFARSLNAPARPATPQPNAYLSNPLANNEAEINIIWLPIPTTINYYYSRSINGGAWQDVPTAQQNTEIMEELTPGDLYAYRLRAQNAAGIYSLWANTTPITAPPKLSNPHIDDTDLYLVLMECAESNTSTFAFEISLDQGATWQEIATGIYPQQANEHAINVTDTNGNLIGILHLDRQSLTTTSVQYLDALGSGSFYFRVSVERPNTQPSPYSAIIDLVSPPLSLQAPTLDEQSVSNIYTYHMLWSTPRANTATLEIEMHRDGEQWATFASNVFNTPATVSIPDGSIEITRPTSDTYEMVITDQRYMEEYQITNQPLLGHNVSLRTRIHENGITSDWSQIASFSGFNIMPAPSIPIITNVQPLSDNYWIAIQDLAANTQALSQGFSWIVEHSPNNGINWINVLQIPSHQIDRIDGIQLIATQATIGPAPQQFRVYSQSLAGTSPHSPIYSIQ